MSKKTVYIVIGLLLILSFGILFFTKKTVPNEQKSYTDAFVAYAKALENDGLLLAQTFKIEGEEPIIILVPDNTGEITQEDVAMVSELIDRAGYVFESRGGFQHNDIQVAFTRPVDHKILLIRRNEMPELLSADIYGEMTVIVENQYSTSLINLAGPSKNNNAAYSNAWSVIQSICLAYTISNPNSDPICNIFSANAAAGWAGIEKSDAEAMINSYGKTSLEYLGSKDLEYRFIEFVYDAFKR